MLNNPAYAGANVLVAGPNFGSGSSREHAPWGLQQYGFDAVIAPSFADIFRGNCAKIGLLTVQLDAAICKGLAAMAAGDPTATVRIDLPAQTVVAGASTASFDIDAHTKNCLLEGLDDIALTLRQAEAIDRFEAARPRWKPALGRS